MKLRNLRGAIRKVKDVKIWLQVPNTPVPLLYVIVQKDSLLKALSVAYNDDPQAETGLFIRDGDSLLMTDVEGFAPPDPTFDSDWDKQAAALIENAPDSEDDLLDDVPATFTDEEAEDVEDLLA